MPSPPTLLAVHISDGVLLDSVWVGGWVTAAGLVAASAHRVREDEVPRIGVLTAAFFVASQIHLPLGGASVHLLLNGLVGVVLGRRGPLALAVGLLLQALLFGHGGLTTLGVNVTVYSVPALVAGFVFSRVWRRGWLRTPAVRFTAVTVSAAVWLTTSVAAAEWVGGRLGYWSPLSGCLVCEPAVLGAILLCSLLSGALERRMEKDSNFPFGLLLGAGTAYATVGLDCLVLWAGGREEVRNLAGLLLLTHLPVVVVESIGIGFVVAYLAKAKPEWLTGHPSVGNTSSSGTSH